MSAMTRAVRLSMPAFHKPLPKPDPLGELMSFTAGLLAKLDDWVEDEWWVEDRAEERVA